MAETIQVNYEQLEEINKRFVQQAEDIGQIFQRLRRVVENLEADWEGEGSQAFFNQMNDDVLPGVQRLETSLEEGAGTGRQIAELFREADEGTRQPFQNGSIMGQLNSPGVSSFAPTGGQAPGIVGAITGDIEIKDMPPPPVHPRALAVQNPNNVFSKDYLDKFVGVKIQGRNSKVLNGIMERLLENPPEAERSRLLMNLADIRGRPFKEIRAEYEKFLKIQQIQLERYGKPDKLDYKSQYFDFSDHPDFLGSTTSLRYGKVVGDVFGIDPVFGSLLNPTGGIMGPGSHWLPQPGSDQPLAYHSIFHDAGGFLKKTFDLGPGYDYLGREKKYDPKHELTGQKSGMRYWHGRMDSTGPDWIVENAYEGAMDVYIWKEGGRKKRPKIR